MNFPQLNVLEIVVRICNSDSTGEAYELYRCFSPLLKDYKFVFAADKGGAPGFAVNRTFSAGASVRSLFKTERILVLDADTVHEMEAGGSTYPIDYSISLDTMALSYLEPHIAGTSTSRIPADFKEVFEFIARDDVYVDPIPYLSENRSNLGDPTAADKIFGKLKAYEVLRTLDTDWLKARGEARSTLTEHELSTRAQQHMSRMYMDLGNDAAMKGLAFRHRFMYACLLKMVSIQLKSPGASLGKKLAEFLEFNHSKLATMSGRETAIARAYFDRGQQLTFFGKVQKGRDDLLAQLSNMAWDMWHVRQLEEAMTFRLSKEARYFFPALLTFDKRLIEVIDLYPLKSCAFKAGDSEPLPFYDGNWFDLVATKQGDGKAVMEQYFSDEARASRDVRRDDAKTQLVDVVGQLENELLLLA